MTTEEIIAWKNFPNILEKARSKANRRYPSILEIDDDAEFGEYDINEAKREVFIEGYLEAEKDLALTWEDMKTIHHIAETMKEYLDDGIIVPFGRNAETFYEEVLLKFNKAKERK